MDHGCSSASSPAVPFLDADTIRSLLDVSSAAALLTESLASGAVDPEDDSPRLFSPAGPGREFLIMPSVGRTRSGVKLVALAPDNPAAGHPAVQGVYVLFANDHLTPLAMLDASELTLLRTPATTAMAAEHLLAAKREEGASGADPPASETGSGARGLRVVVYGTGPQAERHIHCIEAVLRPDEIAVVGRRAAAVDVLVARTVAAGAPVRRAAADPTVDLARAHLVICVTAAATPLFADEAVSSDAVVCAVGAHGPQRHELPVELVRRSDIVVEARVAALRESGNVLQARPVDAWGDGQPLTNLAELVSGRFVATPGRPAVFTGVGMAWQDLVIASSLYDRHAGGDRRQPASARALARPD